MLTGGEFLATRKGVTHSKTFVYDCFLFQHLKLVELPQPLVLA